MKMPRQSVHSIIITIINKANSIIGRWTITTPNTTAARSPPRKTDASAPSVKTNQIFNSTAKSLQPTSTFIVISKKDKLLPSKRKPPKTSPSNQKIPTSRNSSPNPQPLRSKTNKIAARKPIQPSQPRSTTWSASPNAPS